MMKERNTEDAQAIPSGGNLSAEAWRVESDGDLAWLTIDVPGAKVNTLTSAIMQELSDALDALASRKDIRCLVVRSGKPGTFIAGADLREIREIHTPEDAVQKSRAGQEVINRLDDMPFRTVAVVDGAALGGGLELALACDYRVVTDNPRIKIGLPETSLGIVPGFGGTYRLPRTVGLMQAVQMILTGRQVDGRAAFRMRLADQLVPQEFVEDRTREFVASLFTDSGRKAVRVRRRKKGIGVRLIEGTPVGRSILFRRARKDLLRKTRGNYPAPFAALRVLRRTVHSSRRRALAFERDAFARLAATPECGHLVDLFFAGERARKLARLPAASAVDSRTESGPVHGRGGYLKRASVLGAGVMGGRIAWLFTKYDIPVVMKDIAWDAVQKGYSAALEIYTELVKRKRFERRESGLKMHHLHGILDYRSLGNPQVVVEAVVENLNVKKQVLSEVEEYLDESALLLSNTSSLSITEMAKALKHPKRFAGMHFFNPPNRMPLVEVISGEQTDPTTVRRTAELAVALGKTPVVVKDRPGFLVNRLLMPYLNEAVHMVDEGVDFLRIDRLVEEFGMPMGPFRLLDEIGIDVGYEVAGVLQAAYGERMGAAGLFSMLKDHPDLLGRKSRKGFYLYDASGRKLKPNGVMQSLAQQSERTHSSATDFDVVHRPIMNMVNEAARALAENVVGSPEELDLALILGIGFPPFRGGLLRYADEIGVRKVHDILSRYAEKFGDRFTASALVERIAHDGTSFYSGLTGLS